MRVRIVGERSIVKGERVGAVVEVDDVQAEALIRGGVVEPVDAERETAGAEELQEPAAPRKTRRR